MKGAMQEQWYHQIPKERRVTEPRINLTFRAIQGIV
jgi:alkylated DNA repair dioxygenase AlkB